MGKQFQELQVGEYFYMFTFLVDYKNGSTEKFLKTVRKNHIGDNAMCMTNMRTTFVSANDMVEVK